MFEPKGDLIRIVLEIAVKESRKKYFDISNRDKKVVKQSLIPFVGTLTERMKKRNSSGEIWMHRPVLSL